MKKLKKIYCKILGHNFLPLKSKKLVTQCRCGLLRIPLPLVYKTDQTAWVDLEQNSKEIEQQGIR